MQFSAIIGQKEVSDQLVKMVHQNRLGHALLFLGREGCGALNLAQAFAQYIVCEKVNGKPGASQAPSLFAEDPQPSTGHNNNEPLNDSCGICPACIKSSKLIHPDIHFCYPVVTKKPGEQPLSTDYITEWRNFIVEKPYGNAYDWLQFIGAENKQGNITAKECNEIVHKMSLKSFEAGYKILILWMPEYLGAEGNKLLKLIEEPPPNTVFIFVAENDALILPTILSRLQLIKLPPLQDGAIARALESQFEDLSPDKALQLASISDGNFREALLHVQNSGEDDWEGLLRDGLNAIVKSGPVAQVKWVEEAAKLGREKQKQFLKYFLRLLEEAVRIEVLGPQGFNADETLTSTFEMAVKLNKICSLDQKEAIMNELDHASYYIERNANAKILFHALTIKLSHIIRNKSLILVN
ncbi:MAG TPA: hypothetical protein PKC62_00055 [Ferruginibacter sp.]|nr:hypothetical protein [Bacteroidota bacterium]MBS1925285.1 hypothetical protein [Bacteroidota bacterium]MCC6692501.1 hypothetical protein [Chitinophagaceae bacterium]HMT95048.1 hypothetical protein [Ferruginibacter sp.]HMU23835.1 hypothetical protein [Ferruginibacter sp.]